MRPPRLVLLAILLASAIRAHAEEPATAPAGTVIVTNMNASTVWFLDVASGTQRASFDALYDPHEVALSSDGRLAAITNYGGQGKPGNHVQIADVASGRVVREFSIEGYERLHGAAFLAADSLLALSSERTGEVLVVSAHDGRLRRALPTGGRLPHMIAVGGRWVYAANLGDGSIARIDPLGVEPTLTWPLGATRTEGLAATPDGREAWTASMETGEIIGIDGATGEVLARIGGAKVPYRLAASADGRTIVVSDPGDGNLLVIDRATRTLRTSIDVDAASVAAGLGEEASPQGFTLSPDGRWAFVSTKAIDRVAVVDLQEGVVTRFLVSDAGPDGIGFVPARAESAP